jgi:hypothetical protein
LLLGQKKIHWYGLLISAEKFHGNEKKNQSKNQSKDTSRTQAHTDPCRGVKTNQQGT